MTKKSAKSNNKSRAVLAALSSFLICAIIATGLIGFYSKGFKDWTKFNASTDSIVNNDNVSSVTGTRVLAMSAQIAAASANTKTVTATILPETAENKKIDWTIAWTDPASTWATGKTVTSYVTVTPTADGANTATVNCLQAFGEQVTVTATSRENSFISAAVKVDYSKKITDTKLSLTSAGKPTLTVNKGGRQLFGMDDTTKYNYAAKNTESIFSKADTYTAQYTVRFNESEFYKFLIDAVNNNSKYPNLSKQEATFFASSVLAATRWLKFSDNPNYIFPDSIKPLDLTKSYSFTDIYKIALLGIPDADFVFNLNDANKSLTARAFVEFTKHYSATAGLFVIDVTQTGTYGTYTSSYNLAINNNVTGIGMSDSEIVF